MKQGFLVGAISLLQVVNHEIAVACARVSDLAHTHARLLTEFRQDSAIGWVELEGSSEVISGLWEGVAIREHFANAGQGSDGLGIEPQRLVEAFLCACMVAHALSEVAWTASAMRADSVARRAPYQLGPRASPSVGRDIAPWTRPEGREAARRSRRDASDAVLHDAQAWRRWAMVAGGQPWRRD